MRLITNSKEKNNHGTEVICNLRFDKSNENKIKLGTFYKLQIYDLGMHNKYQLIKISILFP